jgi:quercetin dioxygenase-like cupin family protein
MPDIRNPRTAGVLQSEHNFQHLLEQKNGNVLRDSFELISPENAATKNLRAGYTIVYPGCRTAGHKHPESEEIFHVVRGRGRVKLGEKMFDVETGDTWLVPKGDVFHAAENPFPEPLEYFWVLSDNIK